jgi:uncharacterized protein YqeY
MVVREQLQNAIRDAAERDDRRRLCTLRLIQTAIRDRDQAHCSGHGEKISASEVANLLSIMVKQREEQLATPGRSGESADQIQREIDIIREFMPAQMDETSLKNACAQVVSEIGAAGLRDVGRTINALKQRYPGQVDVGRASGVLKGLLR